MFFALLFGGLCAHLPLCSSGVAGGPWEWLLGRWSAQNWPPRSRRSMPPKGAFSTLGRPGGAEPDCAAVLGRGAVARKLAALCRGQSSAQTAAPSLMWKCAWRRTRPTACAPRHRPSRLPHGPPATPLGLRVGMRRAIQKVEQKMIAALALYECAWCRFQY